MNITRGPTDISFEAGAATSDSLKRTGAAKDFEALLVAQMMRTMREAETGWLSSDNDGAAAVAFGMGEMELSRAIARGGGFGLNKLINGALEKQAAHQADTTSRGAASSES